jgi:hypothetical protein
MRCLILVSLWCVLGVAHAADDVKFIKDLTVKSPEIWSIGAPICIQGEGYDRCFKVTPMGEIDLRRNGQAVPQAEAYVKALPPELSEYVGKFSRFTVRYLSLDNPPQGKAGFIVQLFFTVVGSGTQAIYAFGDYSSEANVLTATGYTDTGWSVLRHSVGIDDQKLIQVGVAIGESFLHGTGGAELPKN